ncbi:flagellar biosynthetic protein FliO [Salipaludibacillus agaradhaerens]|uniref:flagellar biosynthetic protein FliO n=1 Tax=Salipaludibacillus agaradhaerens TaxID=76935 RepID=UPI00215094EB|nr:flagellar biosynthetic protein FliO [Salipaludibacillus agaradhaerens]MCR6107058.1 flagellar biosynthetic protein FliO [Salipaludibacillus agaradhaerens]MCR6119089.1 flagellar biosynthetic protein FliO [Salipaludibacillus agaradhaerens]UJW58140.1 flagellar biosynthetic protein FliO [Bacillus sp. A116_S68]
MRKLLVMLIVILFFPSVTYGEEANDFGEGDRNVNELLNNTVEENNGLDDEGETEELPLTEDTNEEEDESDVLGAASPNLFTILLQMVLALGAVLFCIYALLKFINKRAKSYNNHATLQTIGGTGVGSNKSVQLVKAGDRLLIVGVGDTVTLLKEIDDPTEVDNLLQKHQTSQDLFDQPVSKIQGWLKNKKEARSQNTSEAAFHNLLDKEMSDVKKSQSKFYSAIEEKDR